MAPYLKYGSILREFNPLATK
ncbi:hypothetical protein KIPB_006877, partial [Kipferlia bialata]|eukprot:g6877.t1